MINQFCLNFKLHYFNIENDPIGAETYVLKNCLFFVII